MWSQNRVYCLLFLLVALLSVVVRGDGDAHPKGDADDIANPSGGADAAAIIQQSKQMMHTSADAADGASDTSTDNKNSTAQGDTAKTFPGGGNAKNMKSHGTCVTGCATQSTQTVGCGTDLSKPECFCKSQDFVVQAFTCVNTTCPEQYHGAAGVFMVSRSQRISMLVEILLTSLVVYVSSPSVALSAVLASRFPATKAQTIWSRCHKLFLMVSTRPILQILQLLLRQA